MDNVIHECGALLGEEAHLHKPLDNLLKNLHRRPVAPRFVAIASLKLKLARGVSQFLKEELIVCIEPLQLIPPPVDIQADVRDNIATVVGMPRCVLAHYAHSTTDELHIGHQMPK